jgi:DNA-binding transcriptional regulator YiaG
MSVKQGSKYFPLYQFLKNQDEKSVLLGFNEIERLIADSLPPSARKDRGFWSNRDQGGLQASAWLEAGFRVSRVDLAEQQIEFSKIPVRYEIREQDGSLDWDPNSLRALRRFLGLSQDEFAEELGVRQQTISEWETGQYQPTRSRSKHIRIVAERAGFPYKAS